MNEEVLLRLGFDASAVKRGTMAMMDQQKKAAMDYVAFWKKAINDREQLEIQADVRAASRSNRARALLRQRHEERTSAFKKELESQRMVQREARNIRGVALENLSRNVIGGGGGGGGHGFGGGINSTAMREIGVIGREAMRGNWSRIPGSISVLAQSNGKLAAVLTRMLANPVTAAVAGLALGVGAVYKMGANARQTMREANDAGFTTTGYQTFLRQADRESGGREAAQSALSNFSENIGALRSGDVGQMRKFRRYGVATTTANGAALSNEQIFSNVLAKYEGMSDPARRAAFAMDMFGESYKKIVKTLSEGQSGFNAAMGKGVQSSGNLAVLSQISNSVGDTGSTAWNSVKRGAGSIWNALKSGYVSYATSVNSGLAGIKEQTERSTAIDAEEQRLIAAGKIKPRRMTSKQFEAEHPELAADLKSAQMRQEDLQNELEDRGKMGLSELASEGRRLTGHIRPRQYTVTARMRTAMKIDDLEASATRAWERGDDAGMAKLRAEADAMRKANPWLKAGDRDPTRKVEEQLIIANKALADVQAMAKFVMSEK